MTELETILSESEEILNTFEAETQELILRLSIIKESLHEVHDIGISRKTALHLSDAGVPITSRDTPIESFTELPSTVNLVHAAESIVSSIGKGVKNVFIYLFKGIAFIFKSIGRFFRWLYNKITGSKPSAEVVEAAKELKGVNANDLLMHLSEKSQSTAIKDIIAMAVHVERCKKFENADDQKLVGELKDYAKVAEVATKELSSMVSDTSGDTAVAWESTLATNAISLFGAIGTSKSVSAPTAASEGSKLGEASNAIAELKAALDADIKASKELKLEGSDQTLSLVRETLDAAFVTITETKENLDPNDILKFADDFDRQAAQVEKFGKKAESQLSKESVRVGIFKSEKTSDKLKYAQVTVNRGNQIAMIALQRLGHVALLEEAIKGSKFYKALPKYAKEYKGNKAAKKTFKLMDVETAVKGTDKQKKDD